MWTRWRRRRCYSIVGVQNGEGAEGGQGLQPRRESGMEEECGMDFEGEIESRKKLDDERKKLQKNFRDVEKLSCVSEDSGQPQK